VIKIEDAERFASRQAADAATVPLRQIRELRDYSFDIVEA
jgi:hypothetical protein